MPTDQHRMTMRPGVRLVVNLLGDKWTVPIIHLLSPGPRRHAELKHGLPGVSQRMLTRTLRRLEAQPGPMFTFDKAVGLCAWRE
jgi:DNA-binding HxlR family transcriptional regulator